MSEKIKEFMAAVRTAIRRAIRRSGRLTEAQQMRIAYRHYDQLSEDDRRWILCKLACQRAHPSFRKIVDGEPEALVLNGELVAWSEMDDEERDGNQRRELKGIRGRIVKQSDVCRARGNEEAAKKLDRIAKRTGEVQLTFFPDPVVEDDEVFSG